MAKVTTRCLERLESSFELNLLQFLNHPETIVSRHQAGEKKISPAWRWWLLVALFLLPVLVACTGKDIGGTSSGWNALVADEGIVYVGTKQGEV